MNTRPDPAPPPGWPGAPWRARRADRQAGLTRASRTAPVCRLWRSLFPAAATLGQLADILANIAPSVLRRRHGVRPGRGMPAASHTLAHDGMLGAACGRVPVATRAGSGR